MSGPDPRGGFKLADALIIAGTWLMGVALLSIGLWPVSVIVFGVFIYVAVAAMVGRT